MIKNYFEAKCRFSKINETGKDVKVTESYLINAEIFTHAEEMMYSYAEQFSFNSPVITSIKRSNISEVVNSCNPVVESDKYFKCKVKMLSIDESAGKEKTIAIYLLTWAQNVNEATEIITNHLAGSHFEIECVSDSKICDIIDNLD
jgi:hypothetical protein